MTDNPATQSPTAEEAGGQPSDAADSPATETSRPKKAAPRRKVASRKESALPPVVVVSNGEDEAVAKVRKPRAPRKKAAAEAEGETSAPEKTASAQPERLLTPAGPTLSRGTESPAANRRSEEKAERDSSPDGPERTAAVEMAQAAPAPASPPAEREAVVAPPPAMRASTDPVSGSPALPTPADATPATGLVAPSPSTPSEGAPPNPGHAPARYQGYPDQGPTQNRQDGYQGQPPQDRPGRFNRRDRHNRHDRQNRYPQQGGNDRPPQGQPPGQYGSGQGQGQRDGQNFRDGGQGQRDNQNFRDNRDGGQPGQGPRDGQNFRDNRDNRDGGQTAPRDGQGSQGQPGGGDPFVSRVQEPQFGEGIVEVSGKGFGFLREAKRNFVQTPADVFVTPEVCRKYNLRDGQWIKGEVRRSSRGLQMFRLTALNGEDPEKFKNLPNFEELTTINPKKRIKLETVPERYTTRVMDLMTPVGKGQRGLIVAPPRTGKTTLLQHIAEAVIKNHPEMKLIVLLVDERPEEVTEIRRTVPGAEIMASSNDSDLKSHTRIAQLAMERCKRLVEAGFDVFMLLDSITRVGRAFNNATTGGRTMSGGIDSRAMEIPRKIFAAARNTEEAGSLTIMATALIETGSKMDDVIFQEFKGTGNMELVLDRKISDQRIYPAVDIFLSGTRREELLLQPWELDKINVIRRGLAGHKPLEAIERLLSFLKKFPTNAQMLTSLPG